MVAQRLMLREWTSRGGQQEVGDGGENEVLYTPETKTPARGRGGCFVVFAKSRKLSLIGAQCQPVRESYEWLTPVSTPLYTGASLKGSRACRTLSSIDPS